MSLSAAIVAVSVAVHLGFVGAIVLAERRVLPPSELRSIDVDLVRPEELEPPKPPEAPKPPEKQPEQKSEQPAKKEPPKPAMKSAKAPSPEQTEAEPSEEKPAKPEGPSGGSPSETKAKLTPEEIASLRAQIQKCWKLPVGIPGMMGLEVVIRVSFGAKGQLSGEPVLLQAPASERGPVLVGIALNALKDCYPFQMPAGKYAEWKRLDLRFTATGMGGIAPPPKNLPKPAKG